MNSKLILLLIFFTCTLYNIQSTLTIYNNKNIKIKNLLERFFLFNKIHEGNFWGEDPNNKGNIKQIKLKLKIDEMVKNPEQMNLFFKNAFIVSAENKKITTEVVAKKVPVYCAELEMDNKPKYFIPFKKLLYPDSKENDKIETFNGSCVVFPAGITPYWEWDENELREQGEIGIVFSNGVNFESDQTADYKNFNGKNKKQLLKEFIDNIARALIAAAHTLTTSQRKKICNLKIPAFGLGQFANYYDDKSQLAKMYLNAIYEALKNESTDMTWHVEFFNFTELKEYKEAFDKINHANNNFKNITLTHYGKKKNLFNKDNTTKKITNINKSDYLTVFCHAGDAHSFLGNGGYADNSLERVLIGYDNNHYLNAIHLLNLFLPEIMGARLPEIQLFEQVELMEVRLPEIQLFEHVELFEKENDDLNIGNNIFFSLLLMSGLTTIIIIAYQSKAIINLISNHFYFNQLLSFMQNK